jgi:hypothetical protein
LAKTIDISFKAEVVSFTYKPIDRKALYGYKKRVAFDSSGTECVRASLLRDGSLLLRSGMSAQGYFKDDGSWVPSAELEAVNIDGSKPELLPATIGQVVEGREISAEEVLSLNFVNTYVLDSQSIPKSILDTLAQGKFIAFDFNPRADYNLETGVLVSNDNGCFALIGDRVDYQYLSLATVASVEDEAAADSDDLDFEMM